MKYTLTKPCTDCPFRIDCLEGWLGVDRAEEIINSLIARQQTFTCHSFNKFSENEDGDSIVIEDKDSQHCAGAMILLEKIDLPNQMMRIAERLRLYDRSKLDMHAPVFDRAEEFIEHHS